MNTFFFATGAAEDRLTLEEVLGARSTQRLVRDEVSFKPPVDPWRAILQAAEQMHSRRDHVSAQREETAA